MLSKRLYRSGGWTLDLRYLELIREVHDVSGSGTYAFCFQYKGSTYTNSSTSKSAAQEARDNMEAAWDAYLAGPQETVEPDL